MSRFLFTRGLFLMLMEFTVVRLGWTFDLGANSFVTQVIWAIGASMVVLSGLIYLPRRAIAAIGLAMIAGHNLLDGIGAAVRLRRLDVDLLHEPKLRASTATRRCLPCTRSSRGSGSWRRDTPLVRCSHSTARSAYAGSSGSASAPRRVSCSRAR